MTLWAGDGQKLVFKFDGLVNGQYQYSSTAGDGAHDLLRWNATAKSWTWIDGSTRQEQMFADHASATLKGRHARLVAGAGIVPGSDPDAEWAETEHKLRAMLEVLLSP